MSEFQSHCGEWEKPDRNESILYDCIYRKVFWGGGGGGGGLPRGLMSFPGDEHHSLDCGDSFMSVSVYPLILYIGLSCVPFIK